MFTSAEYQLLGKRAPEDLKGFFEALGIPATAVAWEDREKVRRLDAEAEKKVEGLLRSLSITDGCYTLLERAKIPFQFSDTTGMLLTSIAEHQDEVRLAMTMKSQPIPNTAEKMSEPKRASALNVSEKKEGTSLYRFAGAGFLAVDVVLLIVSKVPTWIVALLGFAGAFIMAKGSGKKAATRVSSKNVTPEPASTVPTESADASFTEAEADRALSVLLHLQRLYQAL